MRVNAQTGVATFAEGVFGLAAAASGATADERKRVYRERYLGLSYIIRSAARGEVPSLTCSQGLQCSNLMPIGGIWRSFTARARWSREHAYGNPPGGLSFLPRLAAAFIRNSRSNSRSSLRWERTWDQILGNGVVDHGMPPRPCGTRGILGSHPLPQHARDRRAGGRCSAAAWISNYHDRAPPVGLWIVGKGVPIRGKRQGIETRIAGVFAAGIVLLAAYRSPAPAAADVGVRDG